MAYALASELNAIVSEASAVPLGNKNMELVLLVFLAQDLRDVLEMCRISPEAGRDRYELESP